MTTETRERIRGNQATEQVEVTVKGQKFLVDTAVPDITDADLDRIKRQVTMSLPLRLVFMLEKEADKDKEGRPLTGVVAAKIVAAKYGVELGESKRTRSGLTQEQKDENAKKSLAARKMAIKAAQAKFGN